MGGVPPVSEIRIVNSNVNENDRSLPQRSLVSSLVCGLAVTLGLVLCIVACAGVYQLRTIGAADFRGDLADYPIVAFAWELFDGAQPPVKPATVAGRVQTMFLVFGLIGVVSIAVGGVAFGAASLRTRPDV